MSHSQNQTGGQDDLPRLVPSAVIHPKESTEVKDTAGNITTGSKRKTKIKNLRDFLGIGESSLTEIIKVISRTGIFYDVVVSRELNIMVCSCPSFKYRKYCKHIFGLKLTDLSGKYYFVNKEKDETMIIGTLYPVKNKIYHFIGKIEGKLICLKPIYESGKIVKYQVLELDDYEGEREYYEALLSNYGIKEETFTQTLKQL